MTFVTDALDSQLRAAARAEGILQFSDHPGTQRAS